MDRIAMIDWVSSENEVLLNPKTPVSLKDKLFAEISSLNTLKGHIFFATSGTSGKIKWVALSKIGLLASAQSVNNHLQSNFKDIWLNPLPQFHVGGVGIQARCFLSKASMVSSHFSSLKWNPEKFFIQLKENHATLTSLVPTQVYDIVSLGLKAPNSLKAIIVGGGIINEKLYFEAVKLGWKILPSYGLTECASQVATAKYGSWNLSRFPLLEPLPHVALTLSEAGFLKIKSESLLTGYLEQDRDSFALRDPKNEGWFTTEDKATFEGLMLKSVSRGENFVKISGESVDLLRLEKILEDEKLKLRIKEDVVLIALEDLRLGYRIHLVTASDLNENVRQLIACYQLRVFPYERIYQTHSVDEIPRSPLKKILKNELKKLVHYKQSPST